MRRRAAAAERAVVCRLHFDSVNTHTTQLSASRVRMADKSTEMATRRWLDPSLDQRWQSTLRGGTEIWAPEIEISHKDNEFIVRADLPGMKKDDVWVDVADDDITISGERRH